ncbi:MAG: hypothetical protein A2539_06975 [Elusimicrobia bacterium RIFOXYD2_FULL_34_15]|nr:MAG: hypothetical protein A2539_06975 [Elusimicrobia bacterium RIFOXYD2_FULL_34_15]
MIKNLFILFLIFFLFVLDSFAIDSEKASRNSVFLFLPMTGWIENEVKFNIPGSSEKQILNDNGQLHGIYMMYANPKFVLGSLGHYSKLDKSYENGYLLFTRYYFNYIEQLQPTIGFAVDYIHFYTQLGTEDIPPLSSLDVVSSIWASHPTIGMSYKNGNFKIYPFIGYFNEQVNTVVSSPGMQITGQNRFGFKSKSYISLDYFSAGSEFDITLYHFIGLDTKFYFRFREDDKTLFTLRNRLDIYFSKSWGVSSKIDYFQDKNETNIFIFLGPAFVF